MTCFRMLMGDFDADAMLQVSVVLVWIYFGTFMIMLLLIMLNMLIAILMDVYSEVKSSVQSSETLGQQVLSIIRRSRENWQGKRVALPKIQKVLEKAIFAEDAAGRMSMAEYSKGMKDLGGEKLLMPADFIAMIP